MKKTFVLGVGAQKSGTTWLHAFLDSHPSANMGASKEYHIFDALHIREEGIRKRFLQRRMKMLLDGVEKLRPVDNLMAGFLADTKNYYDYFESLLEPENVSLTGDITPSYSGLPIDALVEIRDEFARRDVVVKVVFLMRDPVERCISAVRHVLKKPGESFVGRCHFGRDGESVLRELYRSEAFMFRTRYDQTMTRIDQVFAPEDVGYFFYETLFQDSTVIALCDFLGLTFNGAPYDQRVNESLQHFVVSEALRREIYEFYRPVYERILERFGAPVKGIWNFYDDNKL